MANAMLAVSCEDDASAENRARSGVQPWRAAAASQAEIVVLGAPRRTANGNGGPLLDRETDFVLRHVPCRVLLAVAPAPIRRPAEPGRSRTPAPRPVRDRAAPAS